MKTRVGAILLAAMGVGFGGLACSKSLTGPDAMEYATEPASPRVSVVPSAAQSSTGGARRVASGTPVTTLASDVITVTVQQMPSVQTTVLLGETGTITGLPP